MYLRGLGQEDYDYTDYGYTPPPQSPPANDYSWGDQPPFTSSEPNTSQNTNTSSWTLPAPAGGWTDLFKTGLNTYVHRDLEKERLDNQRLAIEKNLPKPPQVAPGMTYLPSYLTPRIAQSGMPTPVVMGAGLIAALGIGYLLLK